MVETLGPGNWAATTSPKLAYNEYHLKGYRYITDARGTNSMIYNIIATYSIKLCSFCSSRYFEHTLMCTLKLVEELPLAKSSLIHTLAKENIYIKLKSAMKNICAIQKKKIYKLLTFNRTWFSIINKILTCRKLSDTKIEAYQIEFTLE